MTASLTDIFPYQEIRPVQVEMVSAIRRAVDAGKHVVLEGSTGMGKTIAALCGILTSPEAKGRRIIYCSRTHKQMDRVIEELRALRAKLPISGISLRGRREMCISPLVGRYAESAADAAHVCSTLRKLGRCEFFENIDEKGDRGAELQQAIADRPTLAEDLIDICKTEELCPYEIAKEALAEVKVVAASYTYLFDPMIRPMFLRNLHADLSDLIIILDEAHNLPNIAVELASDTLTDFSVAAAMREAKEFEDELAYRVAAGLRGLIRNLVDERIGEAQEGEEALRGEEFVRVVEGMLRKAKVKAKFPHLAKALKKTGEEHITHRLRHGGVPRSAIHKLGTFLESWGTTSKRPEFLHMISKAIGRRGQPVIKLEVQALDPRLTAQPVLEGAYATISMSGTLAPLDAYRDVIGLSPDAVLGHYPSPFPVENVLAVAVKGVTTKESCRGREMYEKLVDRIAEAVESVPANIGVFAASYEVLEGLLSAGLTKRVQKPLFVEEREMSSAKNDRLIRGFKSCASRGGAVLLGVQGGRNSEGGDFPGDQMNAVVVVGIPYGRPTKRTKMVIDYYESQFPGRGGFYGYYLPAHRRMCQAAGRAHRLLTDRAAVIFMDWRVATAFVRRSLPSWLCDKLEIAPDGSGALARRLSDFFS